MTTGIEPPRTIGTPFQRSSALPASYYTDEQMYRLEEEVIFRRGWIPSDGSIKSRGPATSSRSTSSARR